MTAFDTEKPGFAWLILTALIDLHSPPSTFLQIQETHSNSLIRSYLTLLPSNLNLFFLKSLFETVPWRTLLLTSISTILLLRY